MYMSAGLGVVIMLQSGWKNDRLTYMAAT